MTRTLNPYEILGVARTADAGEIRAAYRRLALKYHPDRNPGDKAAENRFKEVSEAYARLRDPEARARYDRFGSGTGGGQPDFSTVDWQAVFEAELNIDWHAPRTGNAVFDTLFGVVTGMMRGSGLLPGEDRSLAVSVSVAEARAGTVRRVRIPGPSVCARCGGGGLVGAAACPGCGGRGALRSGAEVDLEIPPRVTSGVKLRLKGLGGPGRPPGDAYARIHIRLPAGVELVGKELRAEVAATPLEASRGTRIDLLGVSVAVPKGAVDAQTIRVAGGGLAGGDLVVTLRIGVWRGLSRQLRDAYGRLQGENAI